MQELEEAPRGLLGEHPVATFKRRGLDRQLAILESSGWIPTGSTLQVDRAQEVPVDKLTTIETPHDIPKGVTRRYPEDKSKFLHCAGQRSFC